MRLRKEILCSGIACAAAGVVFFRSSYRCVVILLLFVSTVSAQIRSSSEFGLEAGAALRPSAFDNIGVIGRVFYTSRFNSLDIEGGLILMTAADDAFGFDAAARFPAAATTLMISMGLQTLVWSNTVSIGVPIRIGYPWKRNGYSIEPSVGAAPSFTLTDDKNFVLVDLRVGIRF